MASSESGAEAAPAPEDFPEYTEETKAALDRIGEVVAQIDEEATRTGNSWQLTLDERQILVITDPVNGRMRIVTPIAVAEQLPQDALLRLLQANFDTALDARYAIAQNLVWGFISPLEGLSTRDLPLASAPDKAVGRYLWHDLFFRRFKLWRRR